MKHSFMQMKKKIPVTILGATGCVGQKFIEKLQNHPWFEIRLLCASERSAGRLYKEAVHWKMSTPIPEIIAEMPVHSCEVEKILENCVYAFSGLDSSVAGEIEEECARAGIVVISNSRNHRMSKNVPLVVGEVNSNHLKLAQTQPWKGRIITNPNCSVIGVVLALKPLQDLFQIECFNVVTLQAVSGAGYPGVASLDILDNVVPYISGEVDKIETEPLKIFGQLADDEIIPAKMRISAQCHRVNVTDGHMAAISVKFKNKPRKSDLIQAWNDFTSVPQQLALPSAPIKPVQYFNEQTYPQPRLHRNDGNGMTVSIGQLHECPLFDYKFSILSHNTIRGAVGTALLNAELLCYDTIQQQYEQQEDVNLQELICK